MGSETSQYQEEEKAIYGAFFLNDTLCRSRHNAIVFRKKVLAIPLVAASETGTAQTIIVYNNGVVGR